MRNLFLGILGILLLPGGGCGNSHTTQVENAWKTAARKPVDIKPALPGGITGAGWHIPWSTVDPKHPHSPPIHVLTADAQDGEMRDEGGNATIRLNRVKAKLYHDGKHAADVEAQEITTDQRSRIVTGTGGVRVVSITDPPDTVITADRMTWDTRGTRLIAEGHAHAVQHRTKNGISIDNSSDRIVYDTRTGNITFQ